MPHGSATTLACAPSPLRLPVQATCTATTGLVGPFPAAPGPVAPTGTVASAPTAAPSARSRGRPRPGTLSLTGQGIKKGGERVKRAGKVKLELVPKVKAAHRLAAAGRAKVAIRVTYTPIGGEPRTKQKKLTLRLKAPAAR